MKKKHLFGGRGFYVALAVVIAGSALASYLAISTMMQKLSTPDTNSITGEEDIPWNSGAPVEQKQSSVPEPSSSSSAAPSAQPSPSSSAAAQPQSAEPAGLQTAQARSFVWPVQGRICAAFSGDELVYNDTMQDWRTHNGTDIAAAVGANVKAPTAAAVTLVKEDAQWGGVVELDAGGVLVRVCGISGIVVKQGDKVKTAQILGTVGTIPAESVGESHIHVEVQQNGAFADPASFVA